MTRLLSIVRPSPDQPLPRPRIVLALLLALSLISGAPAAAQSARSNPPAPPAMPGDSTIDAALREQTIQQISDLLIARYVFPETAAKCAEHLQSQLKAGVYDKFNTTMPFADVLTRDLQSVSHDKHLRVNFSPMRMPPTFAIIRPKLFRIPSARSAVQPDVGSHCIRFDRI